MIGVVAFPVLYGSTGINISIVNHESVVYRKYLGRGTPGIAMAITDGSSRNAYSSRWTSKSGNTFFDPMGTVRNRPGNVP
jgi:hypothetical protein